MSDPSGIATVSTVLDSLFGRLAGQWAAVFGVTLLLTTILWACGRTGSTHIIVTRLWRVAFGKREKGSDLIDDYLRERDALMHFRMMTSLKRVGTASSAHRIIHWLRCNDVDVARVGAAGPYFDVETVALKAQLPGNGVKFVLLVLSAMLLAATAAAGVVGATAPALLRIVQTGNWYAVGSSATYRYTLGMEKTNAFAAERCGDVIAIARDTGYLQYDVTTLCEILQKDEIGLRKVLRGQYGMALLIVFYGGALAWLSGRALVRAAAATQLRDWLQAKRQRPPRS
jgi:Family of unknown function (DUF6216)